MRTSASRTAILVCQGRAAAHDRTCVGRFSDPVAQDLLGEEELVVVGQVRDGAPPKGAGPRLSYEFVSSCAAVIVPRTVAIDDAIRERPVEQLVILGAGLDTRAWRMNELAGAVVFEVDHPATQLEKRERLGTRTACAREVRFVATDFTRNGLDHALETAGHRCDVVTTWVWEGVVPYLTAAEVAATVAVIQRRSRPGCRLVVNYQVRSAGAGVGRFVARLMMRLARTPDPWHDEPHRSRWTPGSLTSLLASHGFDTLRDQDLLQLSAPMGLLDSGDKMRTSLLSGHVLLANRR